MVSLYNIGDTVLLKGTVMRVEQIPDGRILYTLREYEVPLQETNIVGRIEKPWSLEQISMPERRSQ